MSNQVDQRVVEMRFDNQNFEKNVQTSLSTLDKLKQRLNLSGAAKGLDEVNASASRVNMNPLSNGVMQVQAKFSALQVMAITALQNITNQAVNAGKRLTAAFTIEPVKAGFSEYETQIGAIQTILANTSHAGTSLNEVNDALDELNLYADKTIYNFTEMTKNIGTFTAAGVDLETSVGSIKGIANLAAVSGSTSQQASTAMYQLSQALAAGKVSLMDWNSVVNAGMGGKVFQDALTRTSELLGTGAQTAIDTYGSFRESLTKGEWLTTEVLTETLKQFAGAYSEADLIQQGFTETQAADIAKMATTASDAATKVKTFTQLMDTLKESAQSGWTQSWEIIIGDFEEAKELFSSISDALGGFIGKISDRRNAILESTFGRSFTELGERLKGITDRIKSSTEPIEKVIDTMKDLGDVVDKVISGTFGNGEARVKALTDAGVNYYEVQNKVNETLNVGFRYTEDQITAQDKLLGVVKKSTNVTDDATKASGELTKERVKQLEILSELSESELKAKGYTTEQIEAIKELRTQADKLGMSVSDFLTNINEIDGRWIVLDSFKNLAKALSEIGKAIGAAWKKIFYGDATDEEIVKKKADALYNIVSAIHRFSETLVRATGSMDDTDSAASKIMRTFQGLFAVIDLIRTIVGGAFAIVFEVVKGVLAEFNLDILDVAAGIGDAIVKFRDWVKENNFIVKGLTALITGIVKVVKVVKDWIDAFIAMPEVQSAIKTVQNVLSDAFSNIGDFFGEGFKRIGEFVDRVKSMDGLTLDNIINAFKDFKDNVIGYFFNFGSIIDTIKNAFSSFANGVQTQFSNAGGALGGFQQKLVEIFEFVKSKIPAIIAILMGIGLIKGISKIGKALEIFASPLEGISDILSNFADAIQGFNKYLNAKAWQAKANAIFKIALAIAVLAGSLFLISKIDPERLWASVGALAALMAMMAVLALAVGVMGKFTGMSKSSTAILSLAASLLLIVVVLKKMEELDSNVLLGNLGTLALIIAGLIAASAVIAIAGPKLSKGTFGLLALVGSLWLMVKVLESIDSMNVNNMGQTVLTLFVIIGALALAAKAAGKLSLKSAAGLLVMVVSLSMFIGVVKKIGDLDTRGITNNLEAFVIVFGSLAALVAISRLMGANATFKAGVGILALSASLFVMVNVMKQLGEMDASIVEKGTKALTGIMAIFAAVVLVSNFAGGNAIKAGAMLLMMSGAILILTGVIMLLKDIDPSGLGKAVLAISAIGVVFAGLILVTKWAQNVMPTLIVLTTAITLLAAALMVLSSIDPTALTTASAALSMVIVVFGLLMVAFNTISTNDLPQKIVALAMLGLIVAALGGLLFILSNIENAGSLLTVITSLSLLLLSLSGACAILSLAGSNAMTALPAAAIMLAIVAGLAAIIGVLASLNIGPTLEIAASLSLLMISLAAAVAILGLVGPGAIAAIPAAAGLLALLGVVAAIILAVGALVAAIPGSSEFLDTVIEVLEKLGYALGAFFGGIIGGFSAGAMSGLPAIGTSLSEFMTNLEPFLTGVRSIDGAIIDGVLALSAAILAITAAELLSGLSAIIGVGSFESFGESLTSFGKSLMDYSDSVKDLTDDKIEVINKSATAGKALTDVAKAIPKKGGVAGWLFGETNLVDFGSSIVAFGKCLIDYANVVKNLTEDDTAVITKSVDAGKSLSNLAKAIPKKGGVAGWLFGETNLVDFGSSIVAFGKCLIDYANVIGGLTDAKATSIQKSAAAAECLTEVAESIPESGGAIAWLFGDNEIDTFGKSVDAFADSLMSYANKVSKFTDSDVENIKRSKSGVEALVAAASVIPSDGGFLGDLFGSSDPKSFGEGIVSLALGLSEYAKASYGITDSTIESIKKTKDALTAMKDASSVIPQEGLFSELIFGTRDISSFGSGMVSLASGLVKYSDAATNISDTDIEAIDRSAKAVESMANAADKIPTEGGVSGLLFGENNITVFGENLVTFADSLITYISKIKGITDDDISAIKRSATATEKMAEAAEAIPDEGGVAGWFTGENNIATFGANLETFANGLLGYIDKIRGITDDDITAIGKSKKATEAMTDAAEAIPDEGGVAGWFSGENNIATFGANLETFANGLLGYIEKVRGITDDDVDAIGRSKEITETLAEAVKNIPSITENTISEDFVTSIGNLKKLVDLAEAMADVDFDGMDSFSVALTNLGNAGITDFIKAFDDAGKKASTAGGQFVKKLAIGAESEKKNLSNKFKLVITEIIKTIESLHVRFKKAGIDMLDKIIEGVTEAEKDAIISIEQMCSTLEKTIKCFRQEFKTAGTYLVEGFASGINEYTWYASARAGAMARAAVTAAEAELDVHSPSRVFYKIGAFAGSGFVNALGDYESRAYAGGKSIAASAREGLSSAISTVSDFISSGVDVQPTIRPVLDLSDVRSGVKTMGGMFGISPSTSVLSNIGSINRMMNNRQNGNNDDVVSAIKDLSNKLGETSGNTNIINGITYDDGSNITEAVKALVRAAKVERRV